MQVTWYTFLAALCYWVSGVGFSFDWTLGCSVLFTLALLSDSARGEQSQSPTFIPDCRRSKRIAALFHWVLSRNLVRQTPQQQYLHSLFLSIVAFVCPDLASSTVVDESKLSTPGEVASWHWQDSSSFSTPTLLHVVKKQFARVPVSMSMPVTYCRATGTILLCALSWPTYLTPPRTLGVTTSSNKQ